MRKIFIPCMLILGTTGASFADVSVKPWSQGWQIGAGIPLVMPLSSINTFVGYANKKSDSFWGKRIGGRLSFDLPMSLKGNATIRDNGLGDGGYTIDANAKWAFIKINANDLEDIDPIDLDDRPITGLTGTTAAITLKNQNFGGMIDFYPFGDTWFLGGIRLSGGYYIGRAEMSAGIHFPNDVSYVYELDSEAGSMFFRVKSGSKASAKFNWKYNGPYAGVGFDLGVFRGFKFYMDAGVVFAKAPKVSREQNVTHPTAQACLGIASDQDCNTYRTLLDASGNKPDVTQIVPQIAADMIVKQKGNYSDLNTALNGHTLAQIEKDLANFFNGGTDVAWIDNFISAHSDSEIAKSITELRDTWDTDIMDLQNDINDAWADYDDAIIDINDSLKDFRFMPMIKIGVMYRF